MDQTRTNGQPDDSEAPLEYEDDFEKDLDWLINEEQENHQDSETQDEDIEAKIDQELQDDEKHKSSIKNQPRESSVDETFPDEGHSEPAPHLNHNDSELDSSSDIPPHETELDMLPSPQEDELSDQDEEAKRYIAEKIEIANRQLEDEQPVDENRERRLKFKEKLIDVEVPPLEFAEFDNESGNSEEDATSRMSQLQISNALKQESVSLLENNTNNDEHKDGKVLVEKDGKFELMSLRDIENQSFLPKISGVASENEVQKLSPRSSHGNGFGSPTPKKEEISVQQYASSFLSPGDGFAYLPRPPPKPMGRQTSATHAVKVRRKSPRRVQSADVSQRNSTFSLSPQQKELRVKIEQQKHQLRKEVEARKREEEEHKRRENEMAFKSWLQKKKEQLLEEKRIREAKVMEEMNSRDYPFSSHALSLDDEALLFLTEPGLHEYPRVSPADGKRDPDEAFQMWLRKKHSDQLKEKQIEELKKHEEEVDSMHGKEECDQAFKQWLKRKRIEKRVEQQAAKERTRRMMMEARRKRQIQNLLYTISDTKSFRLTDHFG